MVAVIAGNGLGLGNTSLAQLGQTSGGQPNIGQTQTKQYLNLATGNLVLQNADEGLIFDGLPLNVLRSYNSLGQLSGSQGWLFGFTRNITGLTGTRNGTGSTITRVADDGSIVAYAYNGSQGKYVSQDQSGADDTLAWDSGTSTWTWTDGASQQQERYNVSGQLAGLSDPKTGASYSFSYSNGQLSQISAGDGDKLTLGYTGNMLTSLSVSEIPPGGTVPVVRQQVQYGYDAQGRLQTVNTTLGSDTDSTTASYNTTYTYDGDSDRVASLTQSDGTTVTYTYAQDTNGIYRVASVGTGSGAQTQTVELSYDLADDTTTMTDSLGNTWAYTYNAAGELSSVIAPVVNGTSPTTRYTYDANGNLSQLIDAGGGVTTYTYDANGNRLSVEDPAGHTVSYTYSADNQVLSQTTYTVPARGVAGQSGYVAPSGAQTTYYVYDSSDRLAFVIDPLGEVTEHDYILSQGITVLSSTKQYVGVAYDLTGLSPNTPPSFVTLQNWSRGGAVRTALNATVRTDYSYDVRGQLTQAIRWDMLSNGNGTLSSDTGALVTSYTYDAQGRLLQQASVRGSTRATLEATSYAYDGLGRLISMIDPLGNITTYVYTDSGNQLAIVQANGLTTTQIRNSAGQLVSSTLSATGQSNRTTSYLYNAAGQQIATVDPTGNTTYAFYDADGRLAGTVDTTGAVTALTYDDTGHVIQTTAYATLVSTANWISDGAPTATLPASLPVPAASADDRITNTLYDASGRVVATVDALGNVNTTNYDGVGNATASTAHAVALTSGQLSALRANPSWSALQAGLVPSVNDRTMLTVYDDAQQPVASIDASGYVTVTTYDTAGRPIKTIAYATALTAAQLASLGANPTSDAVQADIQLNANDQTTRTYYDNAGRVTAQIDADGYLTVTAYNETTHSTASTRYATALTASQLSALTGTETSSALVALLGTSPSGQVTTTAYDADGRLLQRTAPDGTVTVNSYDSVGQLLSTTVTPASGQGSARTISTTYDAFGETLTQIDGSNQTITYTYNALGQRVTATDPLGNITYSYYDAAGRLAYTIQGQPQSGAPNKLGAVTSYAYNAFGQVATSRRFAGMLVLTSGTGSGTTLNATSATTTQVASAASALANPGTDATTSYTYTLDGRVASTIDGLGYQTAYQYDAFGDLIQQQQQLSNPGGSLSAGNSTITRYAYDNRSERTGETDGAGTGVARITAVAYDAFGRVISTTDARGSVVSYTYDGLGRQVSTSQWVQGAARIAHTSYDAFARVVSQTDAMGKVTSYQYDLPNHKTIVTTADGVKMTTVRDAFGDTVSVTDGMSDTTSYTYDADGRLLTTKDALGNTSSNQYDGAGHLIQSTDATGHVIAYSYDADGRVLTRTVDPNGLGLVTAYRYDGQGRQLRITDPTGSTTTFSYDADGHLLTQVQDAGALNLTTTYTYDATGKTLTATVGAGEAAARTTQYVYDNLGRLSQQIVDPSGLALRTSYSYDGNDNLLSVTDANGHLTSTIYNEANQAVATIDGAGAATVRTYDADGRTTSVRAYATALTGAQLAGLGSNPTLAQVTATLTTTGNDQVSYTAYNAEGQARYTIDPLGYVTETRYDSAGRVSEVLSYANAVSVTASTATALQQGTALASLGSLVSGAGNTDANAHATLHLYDTDGQERFTVRQNSSNGLVGQVTEQRYDAAGRLVATVAYGSTLPLSTSQSLATQLTTSSVTQALASAPSHTTYRVYDNAGRLRYQINAARLVTETQYDADGRVLATIAYANPIALPGTQTVATLASAVAAANNGTAGARISTLTYDTAGRIIATGDALGTNATFQYNATGLQTGRSDRDGYWTYTGYDHAGRKILEQSPAITVGSYSGGVLQTASQYLFTAYSYDGVGNVTAITQSTGANSATAAVLSITSYGYDAVGHQVATTYTDPVNPNDAISTHVQYNALGEAVVDQDANGNYQYRIYDTDGQVAYGVDGNGYLTANKYDAYGNVTSVTRSATALNTAAISGWIAGQPLSLAQIGAGTVASSGDRTVTTSYDLLGQKTQVQQSSIAYVLTMGSLAGSWSNGSPTTTFTYDTYGNQTSTSTLIQGAYTSGTVSTPAIWATAYTYFDALNRAVMTVTPTGAYTAPQGYITTTSYDAFGDVSAVVQYATAIGTNGLTTASAPGLPPAGTLTTGFDRSVRYGYDSIGRKASLTTTGEYSYQSGITSDGSITSYTYDGENRILKVTVTTGTTSTTTTTAYDALGRVVSVTAPQRSVLVSNWQALLQQNPSLDLTSSSLYTTVSPLTTYIYDALGHVLSTKVSAGGLSQQTLSRYDAFGRLVEEDDANNVARYSAYDSNGNVVSQSYGLTGFGTNTTVTTTYTYDATNQQLSTATQRSGQSGYDAYVQVKYNAFGEITARGDNKGYEASYGHDLAGNLTGATDPKTGAQHSYGRDLAGRMMTDVLLVTGGGGKVWTSNVLDLAGNSLLQDTPSNSAATGEVGPQIQRTYDRWGNVLSYTDAAGNTTRYHYDSLDHVVQEIEPNVMVASASGVRTWQTPTKEWYYDATGLLTGVTDENGNYSSNTYDGAGNLVMSKDGVGNITYTAYDALGRAVAQQTPPVQTEIGTFARITWTAYDALGQVTGQGDFRLNSAGTARTQDPQQTYLLNSNGDRMEVTDALGDTSYYSYDSQHRVLISQTKLQHDNGWQETSAYDVNGNKISDTDANGNIQSWVYDYFGRVQSHTDLSGAVTSYTYDASSGLLTQVTSNWASGESNPGYLPTSLTGNGSVEQYQYEADGQVAKITQITGGTTASWDSYQYDVNGNQSVDATYTVDGAGEVVHTETLSRYDSHNRLSVVTTENPDNSVANTRTLYNYDAAGNRRAVFVQSAYDGTPISGSGGAPTATSLGTLTVPAGTAWNDDISSHFIDNVGFGLTYAATGLPSWLTLSSNGTFSGTPTASGSWTVTIVATDASGQSVTTTVVINVPVAAPVFSGGISNQVSGVGGTLDFTVPGATDANDSALAYSATLSSGAALPSWLRFDTSTLTFTGSPASGSAGTYTIAVKASAANGGVATETFTLTVMSTPPVANGTVSDQTVPETRLFAFTFPTSVFSESDGSALTFSAGSYTIDRETGEPPVEDDSALPFGMTLSVSASTLTFSGTPPASTVGQTFKLYIKATNPQGQQAEVYFNLTVSQYTQPPPVYNGGLTTQSGVIGTAINLPLPANAFGESDGGALTYTGMVQVPQHDEEYPVEGGAESGSRTIPAHWVALSEAGLSINATTGAITGIPKALVYLISTSGATDSAISYPIEVIATNAQGGTATGVFQLNNTYPPPAVATPIPAQTFTPGATPWLYSLPTNTFTDPYGHGLTYKASNLPSWLTFNGGTFQANGASVPVGSYAVTVTATDGNYPPASASTTLKIQVLNATPVLPGIPGLNVIQNSSFTYQVPAAVDPNGEAITYASSYWSGSSWVSLPSWVSFNVSTRTFSGKAPASGSYQFIVGATDPHGVSAYQAFTMTVSATAQPPKYTGTIANQEFVRDPGIFFSLNASGQFTDPQGQAMSYSATLSNGAALPTWLSFNATTQVFSGTPPTFTTLNDRVWTIQLTATDKSGGSSSITFSIDDPSANKNVVTGLNRPGSDTILSAGPTGSPTTTTGTATTAATTANIQSYWFTYDADNRVVVSNGQLVNGQIQITAGAYGAPSYANQYDGAGNVVVRNTINADTYTVVEGTQTKLYDAGDVMSQRLVYNLRNELVESDYATDLTQHETSLGAQQRMAYDAGGHLLSTYTYLRNDAVESVYGTIDMPNGYTYLNIGGWVWQGQTSTYDADGRVGIQTSYVTPYTDWRALANRIQQGGDMPDGTATTRLDVGSTTTYTGYDHVGNVTAYSFNQAAQTSATGAYEAGFGATYTVSYLKKDGYLEKSTSGTPTVSGYIPATDTSYYDAFGRRLAVAQVSQGSDGTAKPDTRVFAYDAGGEIVQRRSGTVSGSTFTPYSGGTIDHYAYAQGQQIGDVDEAGYIHVLDSLTGFSSGPGSNSYVVETGDTLASIAQAVYGNSDYGYIVGDANGLSGDGDLVVGQTLTLPSITTRSNTANTFKPYNPNEIVGSTTPALQAVPPPPPSSSGCSGLAQVVVIAVIIVASIYTAGAAAEAFGAAEVGGSTIATGVAAAGGSLGAAGIAGAAVGGVVGSLAGQLTGDALGVSHGISWNQALTAGLAAGFTAGLGARVNSLEGISDPDVAVALAQSPQGAPITAADGYVSQVGAAKVTGQATHFSWAGLTAAAVAAGVTAEAGLQGGGLQRMGLSSGTFQGDVAGGLLSGSINRETAQWLGDTHVANWSGMGEDAFGNALGNATIAEANAYEANALPPVPYDTEMPAEALSVPAMQVDDIPQSIAPLGYAGESVAPLDYAKESFSPATASDQPVPANVPTLGTVHVTPNGSWVDPTYSAQDNAMYEAGSAMEAEDDANRLALVRVSAELAAERQQSLDNDVRAAQIERAQLGMLGQGIVGAAKAVGNLPSQTANGLEWLAQKSLAAYALSQGSLGEAEAINNASLPQVRMLFHYAAGYVTRADMGNGTDFLHIMSIM